MGQPQVKRIEFSLVFNKWVIELNGRTVLVSEQELARLEEGS